MAAANHLAGMVAMFATDEGGVGGVNGRSRFSRNHMSKHKGKSIVAFCLFPYTLLGSQFRQQ